LVCYNDMAALGALSAARDLGLAVPRDLSVVGYDNTHLAGLRHIDLTSVDNASRQVGQSAAAALVEQTLTPGRPRGLQLLAPSLVVRGTTRPAAS